MAESEAAPMKDGVVITKTDAGLIDLAYITDRIIAMGFPPTGQNSKVVAYLDYKHRENYQVYNLCDEKKQQYPPALFHDRVVCFPFVEHLPPMLDDMTKFCEDAADYLNSDEKNVVVVHGKHGKGRTGVMICALLLYMNIAHSAEEAIEIFNTKRCGTGQGITCAGQKRYIYYYEKVLKGEVSFDTDEHFELLSVTVDNINMELKPGDTLPYINLVQNGAIVYSSKDACTILCDGRSLEFRRFIRTKPEVPIVADEDISVQVILKSKCICKVYLHTAFIPSTNRIVFTRSKLESHGCALYKHYVQLDTEVELWFSRLVPHSRAPLVGVSRALGLDLQTHYTSSPNKQNQDKEVVTLYSPYVKTDEGIRDLTLDNASVWYERVPPFDPRTMPRPEGTRTRMVRESAAAVKSKARAEAAVDTHEQSKTKAKPKQSETLTDEMLEEEYAALLYKSAKIRKEPAPKTATSEASSSSRPVAADVEPEPETPKKPKVKPLPVTPIATGPPAVESSRSSRPSSAGSTRGPDTPTTKERKLRQLKNGCTLGIVKQHLPSGPIKSNFVLSEDESVLSYSGKESGSILIEDISDIYTGRPSAVTYQYDLEPQSKAFKIVFKDNTRGYIEVIAPTRKDRDVWVSGLMSLVSLAVTSTRKPISMSVSGRE